MRNLARNFTMRRDGVLPRGDWFSIQNKADEEAAKVYIYDEIGFWGTDASDFVKEINGLGNKAFELHINSPGGEVFDGIAIHNAIKQYKGEVTVYVDGLAASAASFIAQAGDKLVIARNAQMMIHDGIAFGFGNEQDHLDIAALLSNISNNIADIYAYAASRRGFDSSVEDFRALMREEVWYTGQEAVDAGLADEVFDANTDVADSAKNTWDLSFYNHAGRERAESPSRIAARLLVSNQAKEKGMSKPIKNQGDPEETPTEPTQAPAEDPTPVEPEPEAPVAPVEPAPEPVAPVAPANKGGVVINGVLVSDWSQVQNHITTLETAQNSAKREFRKNFVEGLSASNKIPATQVDSLISLVNGTDTTAAMSDEQFAAFQASYESAPASSLFQNHGGSGEQSQSGVPVGEVQNKAQRVEVLEGVVGMLQLQMSKEQVEKSEPYLELQKLKSES